MTEPVLLIPRFVKFTKRDNSVLGMILDSTSGSREHPNENECFVQEGMNVWPNIPLRGWTFTIPPLEEKRDYYVKAYHPKLGTFDVPPAFFSALVFKYGNQALSTLPLAFGYIQVGSRYVWTLAPNIEDDIGIARISQPILLGVNDLVEGKVYRIKGYRPSREVSFMTASPLRFMGIVCKGTIWERALFIENHRLHFIPTNDLEVEAVDTPVDLTTIAKFRTSVVLGGEFDDFFKQLQQFPRLAEQYGGMSKVVNDEDIHFIQNTFVDHVLFGAILGRKSSGGYHHTWGVRNFEYKKTKGGFIYKDLSGVETLIEWQPPESLFHIKQQLFRNFKLEEPLDSKSYCLHLHYDYRYSLY